MAFGFARISRGPGPEASCSGQADDTVPHPFEPAMTDGADHAAAFEFEHVHGDTCSCNLRGE